MPKDLTKLSLKDFEAIADGDFDSRMHWHHGALELTVSRARTRADVRSQDDDE